MHRVFLPIYRYLSKHKAFRYTLLIASTLIFLFFGARIYLEEDVIKLLPRSSVDNVVAFSDIGLTDKVFLQITSSDPEHPLDPSTLAAYMDEYTDALLARDSTGEYITMILSSIGIETALGAMDYGFAHLPSFIDTTYYTAISAALEPEAMEAQMEQNVELMAEDMDGTATQMVCTDPFNLRSILLDKILPGGETGGYAIVDGHFFCPDKTVALAFLSPSFHQTNSGKGTRFNRILTKERKLFEEKHPDARVLAHGAPLGGYANASTIKKDVIFSVGISLIVILIILLVCFRRPAFILHLIAPAIYGTAFALACIYWLKGYMSLMALGCGAIVLGVALSYCLHILIHYVDHDQKGAKLGESAYNVWFCVLVDQAAHARVGECILWDEDGDAVTDYVDFVIDCKPDDPKLRDYSLNLEYIREFVDGNWEINIPLEEIR